MTVACGASMSTDPNAMCPVQARNQAPSLSEQTWQTACRAEVQVSQTPPGIVPVPKGAQVTGWCLMRRPAADWLCNWLSPGRMSLKHRLRLQLHPVQKMQRCSSLASPPSLSASSRWVAVWLPLGSMYKETGPAMLSLACLFKVDWCATASHVKES